MKKQFTIAVTCVGGRYIHDILIALRDAPDFSLRVIGVDADPFAAGRLLCDHFIVLPMADRDPDGWLTGLLQAQKELRIDAVICLSDAEARLFSRHREDLLARGFRSSVSSYRTVQIMTDKLLLLQELAAAGLDVGEFAPVSSPDDIRQVVGDLGYPDRRVVIKPRDGRGSRGVLVCNEQKTAFELLLPDRFCGEGTLDQVVDAAIKRGVSFQNWLAVPYWDGAVYDVEVLSRMGKVLASAARRRQFRNPFWPASTGHIVEMNPVVLDYAHKMVEVLKVDGAGDFDIALRPDGKPTPFDASSRFSGSVGGTYAAGMNILAQLVRVIFDLPLLPLSIRNGCPLRPFLTMAPIPESNRDDLL